MSEVLFLPRIKATFFHFPVLLLLVNLSCPSCQHAHDMVRSCDEAFIHRAVVQCCS